MNQPVNLTPYDAQAAQIAQRLKLAQVLQQQSQQPIEVGSYKGIQAPVSPYAGLNKILQAAMAAYDEKKAGGEQKDLETSARQDAMDTIGKINSPTQSDLQPTVQFTPNQPTMGSRIASALGGGSPEPAPPPQAAPMPTAAPAPPQQPMAPPALPAGPMEQPNLTPVDGPPQQFGHPTTAQDRANLALQAVAGGNPYLKDIAPTLYSQAQGEATQERNSARMAAAMKGVDIGDADPHILQAYLASDKPDAALGYLAQNGMETRKAAATLADIKAKAAETSKERELQREFQANQNEQNRKDRLAMHADSMAMARASLAARQSRGDEGHIDPQTIDAMAQQAWAGDKSVFANLGRGQQGAANIAALRKAIYAQGAMSGKTPADLARMNAEFTGTVREQSTIGQRIGAADVAISEVPRMTQLSQDAYAKLPRGSFRPLNQLQAAVARQTASPEQAAAVAADYAVINAYARALSPTGQPHEADKKRAEEMINRAQSQEEHAAVLSQINKETVALQAGASAARGGGAAPAKTIVRTGTDKATGRRVAQYSDGTTGYVP